MDMFEKIKANLTERMAAYTDSRHPTGDEVRIAWLVSEVEELRAQVYTLESEIYAAQEN